MKVKVEIEKLIAKHLLGIITDTEKEQLNIWLKSSPKHEAFFNRLCTNSSFREQYESYAKINSHHAWRYFQKKYCPSPIIRFSTLLKYAAILLLPVVIGVGAWYLYPSVEKQTSNSLAMADTIQPGIAKALLTISESNQQLLHPSANQGTVQISQSTTATIQNGTLVYAASASNVDNEKKQDTEIVEDNTLTTDQGNEFKVTFEDGTTVHLNYNTEIRYPVRFDRVKRMVFLKGEAYFKIAKDKRPFYVVTDEGTIKQYGTEFNVNTFTPQQTQVALVRGSISIIPNGSSKEHLLQPGQLAHTDSKNNSVAIHNVDLTPYIAWNEGRLIFENRTLESIAEILEHWYNVNISFGSAELRQLHFTGNMDRYGTISPILKAIARTTNLHIQIEGREILITGN